MIKNVRRYVVLLLMSLSSIVAASESDLDPINVTFIVPDKQGPLFWQLVTDVSISAAQSLDINFTYVFTDSDRFAGEEAIKKIINSEQKPDYLIFRPYLGNSQKIFQRLERHKLPFLTIERAFHGKEADQIGRPQTKFKYWVDELNYDDELAGKVLADYLVTQHQKTTGEQQSTIVGLGGDFDSISLRRQSYLESVVASNKDNSYVEQIFPMYWNPLFVREKLPQINERYPNADIYWSASDQMALEVISFFQKYEDRPSFIGGFDWVPQALRQVKQGNMTASMGGHFLIVSQALVTIVDHKNGQHQLDGKLKKYELVNKDNVDEIQSFIEHKLWQKIDFKKFTKNGEGKVLNIQQLLLAAKDIKP